MSNHRNSSSRRSAAGSASWLTLVAATSLGIAHADTVRTRVKLAEQQVAGDRGPLRLIVQSYAVPRRIDGRLAFGASGLPEGALRPLGSAQRVVTTDDLARGVSVELVELASGPHDRPRDSGGLLVAWIERAAGELDLDGLGARPSPGSVYGIAPARSAARGEAVPIWLNRRA